MKDIHTRSFAGVADQKLIRRSILTHDDVFHLILFLSWEDTQCRAHPQDGYFAMHVVAGSRGPILLGNMAGPIVDHAICEQPCELLDVRISEGVRKCVDVMAA